MSELMFFVFALYPVMVMVVYWVLGKLDVPHPDAVKHSIVWPWLLVLIILLVVVVLIEPADTARMRMK